MPSLNITVKPWKLSGQSTLLHPRIPAYLLFTCILNQYQSHLEGNWVLPQWLRWGLGQPNPTASQGLYKSISRRRQCISSVSSCRPRYSHPGRHNSLIYLPPLFGAKLTALTKRCGGVRPIAVGCTLSRLASKCACFHALNTLPQILAPHQLGFGITAGAEAAVQASRVYIKHLSSDKAVVKVDFQNAFNSIRRDRLLKAVEDHIPDLLPFVYSAFSSPSILMWGDGQLLSTEGIQQGDPLGPMLFCLGIHKLVSSLSSEFCIFYLDDGTIGGNFEELQADLEKIEDHGKALGLLLNVEKSELISHCQSAVSILLSAFSGLQFVHVNHAKLLGSPLGNEAMRSCLEEQLSQLKLIGNDSTICICMMPSQSSPSLNSSTSFVLPQPFPHPF